MAEWQMKSHPRLVVNSQDATCLVCKGELSALTLQLALMIRYIRRGAATIEAVGPTVFEQLAKDAMIDAQERMPWELWPT